jgi:hypothetical protein
MHFHEVDKEVKELLMDEEEILLTTKQAKGVPGDQLVHLIQYMSPIFW